MPLYPHANFGDVQSYTFMKGTITSVDSGEDTANVMVPGGSDGVDTPLFYHCDPDSEERGNGAIEGAGSGFNVDDEVIVMCTVEGAPVRIVGFVDGPKLCRPDLIILFRAGYRVVAWDLINNEFPLIPKSGYDEEAEQYVYSGEYVQPDEWPLGHYNTIMNWIMDSPIVDADTLFESDWVKTPPLCPVDDISVSVDDGSGFGINESYLEWRAASREQGSVNFPWPPAPDSATQTVRTWNTIFGESTHTVEGHYRLERQVDESLPGSAKYQLRVVDDHENYNQTEWSGTRFTCLNPAGGILDFTRLLTRIGNDARTYYHEDWISFVTKPWGDDNHRGYDQSYLFSAKYSVPIIGAASVFNIADIEEEVDEEWDCVLNDEEFAVSDMVCTPTAPDPTPMEMYNDQDNPKAAILELMAEIVCETREPDAVSFEEQRVNSYVYGESSLFDPAVILVGKGLFSLDENTDSQWMACMFVREKTEVLPNCMDFEVFVATIYGGGVASQPVTAMNKVNDTGFETALIEMINLETQTGELWRAHPYMEVRNSVSV